MARQRAAVLSEWLAFWQENEARAQRQLRRSLQCNSLPPAPRPSNALANAMAVTPVRGLPGPLGP